jgi:hypothetical protein
LVQLADPDKHLDAITSRPLTLHAVGKQSTPAEQLSSEQRQNRILSKALVKYLHGCLNQPPILINKPGYNDLFYQSIHEQYIVFER